MNPAEYSDVGLGYIDYDTLEEIIVDLPEISSGTLVFEGLEKAGYVYGIGRSIDDKIGVYRLENKLINGAGNLSFKNVEGLARAPKSVKDSITAAFNYFCENSKKIISGNYDDFDYSLYFNDLQNRNVCDELSVAEVVGLFSGLANRSVLPSLVICGRVVMSGSMMPITSELEEIFVAAANAGAKRILMPEETKTKCNALRNNLQNELEIIFYKTPLDAAKKALGLE